MANRDKKNRDFKDNRTKIRWKDVPKKKDKGWHGQKENKDSRWRED